MPIVFKFQSYGEYTLVSSSDSVFKHPPPFENIPDIVTHFVHARSPTIPIDIYFLKLLLVTDSSCVLTFTFTL